MKTVYDYTTNAGSVKDLTSHRNNKLKQRINAGTALKKIKNNDQGSTWPNGGVHLSKEATVDSCFALIRSHQNSIAQY